MCVFPVKANATDAANAMVGPNDGVSEEKTMLLKS